MRKNEKIGLEFSRKDLGTGLNNDYAYNVNRQVCGRLSLPKNLAPLESGRLKLEEIAEGLKRAAGATIDTKSLLFNFAWWLKKEGYAETIIATRVKLLKILANRGANLLDPESVKETIARQKWCNKRKVNAADAYAAFLRMNGKTWDPPRYKVEWKLPFIPTEQELMI